VAIAVRDAEVSVRHMGVCSSSGTDRARGSTEGSEGALILSFVLAIWVRRDARSLRRSVEG